VSDVIEAPIDNWLASFDGRVLEIFTPYREGSMRYHAALMVDCRIDGTTLTVDFQRREVGLGPFKPEQLPASDRAHRRHPSGAPGLVAVVGHAWSVAGPTAAMAARP
jgi:hypothetical protein